MYCAGGRTRIIISSDLIDRDVGSCRRSEVLSSNILWWIPNVWNFVHVCIMGTSGMPNLAFLGFAGGLLRWPQSYLEFLHL